MSPRHNLATPWVQEDGHLTELALTAAADGADVLPDAADAHLATCEVCTGHLVALAQASVESRELLELAYPAPAPALSPLSSVPWSAVAAALCVGLGALSPRLLDLPNLFVRVAPGLRHGVPVLVRGVLVALSSRGPSTTLAMLTSSFLLIAAGIAVSRVFRPTGALS